MPDGIRLLNAIEANLRLVGPADAVRQLECNWRQELLVSGTRCVDN